MKAYVGTGEALLLGINWSRWRTGGAVDTLTTSTTDVVITSAHTKNKEVGPPLLQARAKSFLNSSM